MKRRLSNHSLSYLLDLRQRKILSFPLSRVWSEEQSREYISSIFYNIPSFASFIISMDEFNQIIVDGCNRFAAIADFVDGIFPLPETCNIQAIRGKFYSSLTPGHKDFFLAYDVPCEYIDKNGVNLITDKKYQYLSSQQRRHGTYEGILISEAESLSDTMKRLLGPYPAFSHHNIRKMLDIEFVIELLMFIELGEQGKNSLAIDNYVAMNDTLWKNRDSCLETFKQILTILYNRPSIITSTFYSPTYFYALFTAIVEKGYFDWNQEIYDRLKSPETNTLFSTSVNKIDKESRNISRQILFNLME